MSAHLDHLAAEVYEIEHAIGDEIAAAQLQGEKTITRLQSLDFLRQSLEDMALLSHFLAKARDGPLPCDFSDGVRLDVTKAIVAGDQGKVPVARPEDVTGELDLF